MSDALYRDLIRIISDLQRRMERLEVIERVSPDTPSNISALDTRLDVLETYQMPTSDANISIPPTDAQLDAAFGTPAVVGDGYIAFVDDAGAHTAVYLVSSDGTNWWHGLLTKAV